jgi:hypothetical protein
MFFCFLQPKPSRRFDILYLKNLAELNQCPGLYSVGVPVNVCASASHHPTGVPNGFDRSTFINGLFLFSTIANGVYIFDIGF